MRKERKHFVGMAASGLKPRPGQHWKKFRHEATEILKVEALQRKERAKHNEEIRQRLAQAKFREELKRRATESHKARYPWRQYT